jgi:hypothetical protein
MSHLYFFQQVAEHLVLLTPVAGHPDQGLPGGEGEGEAGQLPSFPGFPGRPGHLPARPGRPVDPGFGRPGGGGGGIPDHELPPSRPPTIAPGWTLILVRKPDGKWAYATLAPSSPPPRPLPEPIPPGGAPDQGLPPQPPEAGQLPGAPPTAQPKA